MSFTGTRVFTERSIRTEFRYELDQALKEQWWSNIAQRITSDQPKGETHDWLGGVPQMAERTGGPKFTQLRGAEFTIRNKEWQSGIRIPKADWDHQKADVISAKVKELAQNAAAHPGVLIQSAIAAAESTACYDGQYFFDTDHSEGASGTQSNDLTYNVADPTAPTAAETVEAILTAISAIYGFKDDQGNPVNLSAKKFLVAAPASHYKAVLKAINQELIGSGESNILAGKTFTLVPQILPNVTGNKLYVFRADMPNGRPFIYQILDDLEESFLGPESEHCKLHNEVLFLVNGTYNVGYGRWQGACLVTLT